MASDIQTPRRGGGFGILASSAAALAERAAIVFALASRKLMDMHGRLETRRKRTDPEYTRGDEVFPVRMEHGQPIFAVTEYNKLRVDLLVDFIDKEKLDLIVVFGCSFGREITALAERVGDSVKIFGADLSQRAIDACRGYGIPNASFSVVDMESADAVRALLATTREHRRVGVYFCETGSFVLPDRMQDFFATLFATENVQAVQVLEALCIDWGSRFELGAMFSYQSDFWRHNYAQMLPAAGFVVKLTDIFSGSLRSEVHRNQPMWLVRAGRPAKSA